VGIRINGVSSVISLTTNFQFTNTDNDISYHILRTNSAGNNEYWHTGIITSATTITIQDVTAGVWDYMRNGGYEEWEVIVQPHPSNTSMWSVPILHGNYNLTTRVLTLNMNVNAMRDTDLGSVTPGVGFDGGLIGGKCRLMVKVTDRITAHSLSGSILNTFNYYLQDFFTLPILRISSVQQLNPASLQPIKDLSYKLVVNDAGLRYSSNENNNIQILDPDVSVALLQPLRVNYLSDLSIDAINNYLNADDTRVVNANQMAKRMETISVDISVSVRSELSEAALMQWIAVYVNSAVSTVPLSKDKIIQYLYSNNVVEYIDVGTFVMNGEYNQLDGTVSTFSNVNEIFGADTATYLARTITVTRLTEQV
jgi:hypothetical protein